MTITSFITNVKPLKRVLITSALPSFNEITPRQIYDIGVVSTYIAFWTAKYWQYPKQFEERPDVEIFSYIMALYWHIFRFMDSSIFLYLWIIGGLCHSLKYIHLKNKNEEKASSAHVGLQMGGQISLLLLFTDLLTSR